MRHLLIAAVLALFPVCAHAQSGSLVTYTSLDHDFTLALPGGGVITDAYSDPTWEEDGSSAVRWVSLHEAAPVFLLVVSAVTLDHDVTDDDVFGFLQGMVDGAPDSNAAADQVSDVFMVGNRGWVSALFSYNSEDAPGQFESFVTRQGQFIYALTFHYNDLSAGQSVAGEVLATFATSGG